MEQEKDLVDLLRGIKDALYQIKDFGEIIVSTDEERNKLLREQISINSERLVVEKDLKVLIKKLLDHYKSLNLCTS